MNKKSIEYHVYTSDQIPDILLQLIESADQARQNAHAPYSKFTVGSAVLLSNGEIVTGNNQENAAYPSGLCAERVALFAAKSKVKNESVRALAVVAQNSDQKPADAFPCGGCRQVMMEYANLQKEPIEIIMRTGQQSYIHIKDCRDLLPFSFRSSSLH